MALIKNRPLGVLDRIYNLVGAQTPTNVEIETPVQLVHDLSREAELGSGLGYENGYFFHQMIQAVAAATTYYGSADIYSSVASAAAWATPNINDYRIWYAGTCGIWVPADGAGDITNAYMGIVIPVDSMQFVNTQPIYIPTFGATTTQLIMNDGAGTAVYPSAALSSYSNSSMINMQPLQIPSGADLTYRIATGAAIAAPGAVLWWHLWIGKKGTTPPGMR